MNTLAACVAAISFAAIATPAVADELRFVNNEIGYEVVFSPSAVTRVQVVADLREAQREGDVARSHEFAQPLELVPSAKSREQVQREAAGISERERSARMRLYAPNA